MRVRVGNRAAALRGAVAGLPLGRGFAALERGALCLAEGEGEGVKQRVTLVHVFAILALVAGLSALRTPLVGAEEATPEAAVAPAIEEATTGGEGETVAAGGGEIEEVPIEEALGGDGLAPVEPVTDASAGETLTEGDVTLEGPALDLAVDEPLEAAIEETEPMVAATPTGDAVATGPPVEENLARLQEENAPVTAATPVDEVEADLGTGTLVVAKTDHMGDPLPGASFEVYTDAGSGARGELAGQAVSDASGLATIGGLATGAYVLVESAAPGGFMTAPDQGFAISAPGETLQLTVVNWQSTIPRPAASRSSPVFSRPMGSFGRKSTCWSGRR